MYFQHSQKLSLLVKGRFYIFSKTLPKHLHTDTLYFIIVVYKWVCLERLASHILSTPILYNSHSLSLPLHNSSSLPPALPLSPVIHLHPLSSLPSPPFATKIKSLLYILTCCIFFSFSLLSPTTLSLSLSPAAHITHPHPLPFFPRLCPTNAPPIIDFVISP